MNRTQGVVVGLTMTIAFFTGSLLTGTGGAHSNGGTHSSGGRGDADGLASQLAEHERRITALEAQLGVGPEPAAEPAVTAPPTTSPTAPATTSSPSTTTTTALAPSPAPGGCSFPSGDPAGAQQIGNQNLGAGQVLENFVLRSSGGHAINPPNVPDTTVRNGSIYANGGDNIKLGDNSRYERLYLEMSPSGSHIDALQGQAATGVTVRNTTIHMQSHGGVTGAVLFQTLRGGGGDWNNHVSFDIDCLKLIGSGPYGHDIRVDFKDGGSVSGRIANIEMSGTILITDRGGGGSCRIEVDASALPHISSSGCEIVPI